MSVLWTELLTPATLTGYAREALADVEKRKGTLAIYLPNEHVSDISVRFEIGGTGVNEAARFRAWDAEPELAKEQGGSSVTLDLPAIGQKFPVSEYRQLRLRNASDASMVNSILKTTKQLVEAVSDRMEHLRGVVLDTGKATVAQSNFAINDDFGRPSAHNVTASTLWSAGVVTSRIADMLAWQAVYVDTNGTPPGEMLMSTAVYNDMRKGDEFLSSTTGRTFTKSDIASILADEGLPPIRIYDRRINLAGTTTRVTSDKNVLFLPAAGEEGLGKTYWGTTLAATELSWGIEDDEQAGIVAAAIKTDSIPVLAEVVADAIGMPVLGRAELSMKAVVRA